VAAEQPIVVRITVDSVAAEAALGRTGGAMESVSTTARASAAALRTQEGVLRNVGVSAGQTAAAMRQLPAQLTDIATQLAGGQNPLLILLQQGGQIKDSFGGIGATLTAFAAAISPVALAVGAVAAAAGVLGAAALGGSADQAEFRRSLQLTGNAAGMTADRFAAMTSATAAAANVTQGAARETLQALVSTGRISQQSMSEATRASLEMQRVTGRTAEDVATDFARMGESVVKWAAEHNKQFHYLTVEQFKYIKQLEDQGRLEEAQAENFRLLATHFKQQATDLGTLERAWKGVKEMASSAWEAMKGVGRAETTGDQIATLRKRIAEAQENGTIGDVVDPKGAAIRAAGLEQLKQELYLLQEKQKLENKSADTKARQVIADDKAIQKIAGGKPAGSTSPPRDDFAPLIRQLNEKLAINNAELDSTTKLTDAQRLQIKVFNDIDQGVVQLTLDQKLQVDGLLQQILATEQLTDAREADRRATEKSARTYAEQTKAFDDWYRQFEQKQADQKARLIAQQEESFGDWFQKFQEKEAGQNMPTGEAYETALGRYLRSIGDQSKQAEAMVTGSFQRMEDALVNFVKSGKLNFSDLFGFMAEEYLRNQIRMVQKKWLTDSAGNFSTANLSSSLGGLGSWISGLFASNSHANGLDYVPYDGYPAILHKGERVLTSAQARSGSQGAAQPVHYDFSGQTVNVGDGVSMGQVMAALNQSNARMLANIQRQRLENRL
jgi:L-lactate utilization protein LutC